MKEGALEPRQARFVEEYLKDLNATQAAIRAGYSAKGADVAGVRLLANNRVGSAIAERKAQRAERVGITQERVLSELQALAFSDVEHYTVDDFGNLAAAPGAPPGVMRAVSSVKYRIRTIDGETTREVEFKLWDKPGTLKLAGRHVGTKGFFDKVEISGPNGGPVEVRTVKDLSSGERRKRIAELAAKRGT